MEPEELVGRHFTILGYPGVYTIKECIGDIFTLDHTATAAILTLSVEIFNSAVKDGKISLIPIAETSTETKPVQEEPEQKNYFSFDDL